MKSSNLTDTSTESSDLTDTSTESSNLTDTSTELRFVESDTLVVVIAVTLGVVIVSCGFLFATACICYCVIQRKKLFKKKDQDSKRAVTGLQQPEPEEIPGDM